jgi:hypothetical protein
MSALGSNLENLDIDWLGLLVPAVSRHRTVF